MINFESFICMVMTIIFLTQLQWRIGESTEEGLHATIRPKQFRCSRNQHVTWSSVCDGHLDCDNGHDEYCRNPALLLKNYTEPCFRCLDGTCISPVSYDINVGTHDWFLCDGIPHCKDSWDEFEDACWRHKNLFDTSIPTLLTCVPSDMQFGKNNEVMMWAYKYCNGVDDCYNGQDEKKCSSIPDLLDVQTEVTSVVIALLFIVIILMVPIGFVIYKIKTAKRQHRSSTSTAATVLTQMSGYEKDVHNIDTHCDSRDDKPTPTTGACHVVLTREMNKLHEMVTSSPTSHVYKSQPKLTV